MKTSVLTIIFASGLAVANTGLCANTIGDEAYIDDIPFNTKAIAGNVLVAGSFLKQGLLPDECYVNDIPFNTEDIVLIGYSPDQVCSLPVPADEAYVDDIPFSTEQIASSALLADKILHDGKCQLSEPCANDIPFDTAGVVASLNSAGGESGYAYHAVTINDPGISIHKLSVIDSPFEFQVKSETMVNDQDHIIHPGLVSILSDITLLPGSIHKKKIKRISFYSSDQERMILQLKMDDAFDAVRLITSDPMLPGMK